jgi:hypothetical protein
MTWPHITDSLQPKGWDLWSERNQWDHVRINVWEPWGKHALLSRTNPMMSQPYRVNLKATIKWFHSFSRGITLWALMVLLWRETSRKLFHTWFPIPRLFTKSGTQITFGSNLAGILLEATDVNNKDSCRKVCHSLPPLKHHTSLLPKEW